MDHTCLGVEMIGLIAAGLRRVYLPVRIYESISNKIYFGIKYFFSIKTLYLKYLRLLYLYLSISIYLTGAAHG